MSSWMGRGTPGRGTSHSSWCFAYPPDSNPFWMGHLLALQAIDWIPIDCSGAQAGLGVWISSWIPTIMFPCCCMSNQLWSLHKALHKTLLCSVMLCSFKMKLSSVLLLLLNSFWSYLNLWVFSICLWWITLREWNKGDDTTLPHASPATHRTHGCYITNKSVLNDSRFGLITLPQPLGMQTVNNNQAHASYQPVIS